MAPSSLSYGQSFSVETPDAASVTRGTLIRLSSVTHAFNQSQLIYPLTFSATGATTISAAGPTNANLAPPGPLHAVSGERDRGALQGEDGHGWSVVTSLAPLTSCPSFT